ncbi:MAG TPA: hypothetical protein VJ828_01145, partial [Lacipirellulaceae bacterium]|nr:hypothetical protein [Lacipirellulaceae bacterium]
TMRLFVFKTAPDPVAVSKPDTTAYPMPVSCDPMVATSELTTLDGVIVNRPMLSTPITGSAPAVCGGLGETLPLELIAARAD